MASTSQSAVEYIKNARTRLVNGGLQNLSVIVENLHQQRVFSKEDVSDIQTETTDFNQTRTILDRVTLKGEKACYELLKIIDITRKRTLNKDLHPWIACFSFRDDVDIDMNYCKGSTPCHKYQAKLKKKAIKLSEDVWKQSKHFLQKDKHLDLSFTPLVLDTQGNETAPYKIIKIKNKKCKKTRPKKMKTYIPEDKQKLSVDDILKTRENTILLVGKTGIGKTTVAHQMLKIWGGSDNKDLDYMFYFDKREMSCFTNHMSLEDLLFNTFSEPDEAKEAKEEVLEDIKRNSENVTIIFDGLTDLTSAPVIKRLVEGDLLPEAKIVITCRPEVESEEFLSDWASFRVEVKGFSTNSINDYLAKMLSTEQLSSILNNVELFSLCHVPVYALMVVACFSFTNSMAPQERCTVTEIYLNTLRGCIEQHSGKTKDSLNKHIRDNSDSIFALTQAAFQATQNKSVNITTLSCEDSCVYSAFLNTLHVRVDPTEWETHSAFLHYTLQEFFAGLWFLKNPDKITELLKQCCTEEMKHMKYVIPFLCGLSSEKNHKKLKCLVPDQQLKDISNTFIREVISKFLPNQDRDDTDDTNIMFLCQCLYESQSTEACLHFLEKLDYCLDLSRDNLDPHHYCAVSYVMSQSQHRKLKLKLKDTVSEQGLRLILGCLENVQLDGCDTLKSQLWEALLLSEEMDYRGLLGLGGNELHLPVCCGKRQVFERAVEVMQNSPLRVHLCLLWDRKTTACQDLRWTLLESLPHIDKLSFRDASRVADSPVQEQFPGLLEGEEKRLLLDLCREAAIQKRKVFQSSVNTLLSLFSVYTTTRYDILLDLYLHISSSKGYKHVLPILKPLYPPAPTVWSIDLSERKASVFLECLKLQPEKKLVELRGWSDEESEVKTFLRCLPYISKLRFASQNQTGQRFLMNLCVQAALHERLNAQTIEEVFSLSEYWHHKWDFLLDLYSHFKEYEAQSHKSVLPVLLPVYQSAAVWSIDLSERKASLLLELLILQPEKKPVELRGWSDEESEVRIFLQCLPYISTLSVQGPSGGQTKLLVKLFCEAAEREEETGEKILEQLSSVCNYKTFPFIDWHDCWQNRKWKCDLLLDLYSYVKNYETQTGRSVLPALKPVYQSAPAVWSIDLSERKVSLLLELLKLQPEKKPVELRGWSDEESEVRIFLQCLPYISQLSVQEQTELPLGQLFCEAAEREEETEENILKQLSSVCNYETFPFIEETNDWEDRKYQSDLLLDLYSYVKNYETQTGRSVLPALKTVYQSAPAVWYIDLSERTVSLLLELLKLQPEKKPVELWGWSDEESEVRIFFQCLPYISQLSVKGPSGGKTKFLGQLFCEAAEREEETGEKILEQLSSVCNYETFPFIDWSDHWQYRKWQCYLLLDLYSYVKNYETQTGRSVLPALKPVYQSAPTVWSIDLSERKVSLLLELLKLQPEKKPVDLTGWSDEESEVRIFLQCLPYISQLSVKGPSGGKTKFLGQLFCEAAEREEETGEKILEQLSSVCNYKTFPFIDWHDCWQNRKWKCDLLLDLYSYVKNYETQTGRSVLPALKPVYQSAPAVWSIDLSERKVSLLLELLKLQPEKKPVELRGWSDEESEVRIFLQCLPYISQLSVQEQTELPLGQLFCEAAEREEETEENILEQLSSVCNYETFPFIEETNDWEDRKYQSDLLLDLYSYVKNYETQTGRSVLPALKTVYQSAPAVWYIDLSERTVSLLLELLKLQPEKKPVELWGWSDEESEVRIFFQCLPYISQLSVKGPSGGKTKFLGQLFCEAAEREEETGEKILEQLSSVCNYETFPFIDWSDHWQYRKWQCYLLLDLYSYVKNYETQTGRSVLPALKPVYQSAPTVWSIDLSERKVSLLLELLKLQPEKKPVDLTGWSDEESEVRIFLQCLPYISQLSVKGPSGGKTKFLGQLFCEAAEREEETGEKILEQLSSVCNYKTFPFIDWSDHWQYRKWQCYLLLDLYSYVKNYETQTGRSVLPALKPVYQSAPAVWSIDLSERKVSLLLELLKLQPEKKPVELRGWSYEESEVRIFLQCLPYISQLSVQGPSGGQTKFLGKLFCEAAEREEETGEKILEQLSSVCNYKTFPFIGQEDRKYQSDLLLDLYSYVKNYETQTGRSVLPALQPVYQSAPTVWSIDLSEKVSLLLELLKLQPEKKPVELWGWSDEKSEVRIFLQCLPYISQLSVKGPTKFLLGQLFCEAAEREEETAKTILEQLSSVCNYKTFPFIDWNDDWEDRKYQCDVLLDLYSYVKNCETQTGRSVLPALQPVYQSVPAVWSIDLSERKASLLLEVMKLQPEKRPVELRGWLYNEVGIFLQCLPYISQLRCDPGFFQQTCQSITVRSVEEVEQLVSLLRLLDFKLVLRGQLLANTCESVGKVLELCGSSVVLVLTPSKISLKEVSLLFRHVSQIQKLGLSESVVLLLFRLIRTRCLPHPVAIEDLSLLKTTPQSTRILSKVVSNVASLLRHWSVRCLDLTKSNIHSYLLFPLLSHHEQLTIKLCPEVLQELAGVVFTAQDEDLTKSFLEKVGGDLTSCSLDWEVLLYLLQQSSAQTITVDLKKNRIPDRSIRGLVPFLDRVVFKGPSPSFTLCAIRETYKCHSSVPSLLRSLDYAVNLNNRELDTVDCDALLFTLKHCDKVTGLSLLWTSIPPETIKSILYSLDKVSHLSADRNLLLMFLHCCTTCQTQQGAAAALLRALQYRLDLSCSSCVDLSEQQQVEALSLTVTHCRYISTVLRHSSSSQDTQLILSDCEVEDSGLDLLFPVLNRVRLRCSKSLLLQLLSLVSVGSERNTVMRAGYLTAAFGGDLDLSETRLDQKACRCLALVLEHSEGLTELDLSHCQLTDQLLETLIPHLHKAQVLDLSHNQLTDALTDRILQLLAINTSIQTVRLFNNCFKDKTLPGRQTL